MDLFSFLNGISSFAINILGISFSIIFFHRFLIERKRLMPYVIILGFSVASLYSGPMVNFFSLLVSGQDLTVVQVGLLSHGFMPIAIINAMALGFEVFNPERKKLALGVYGLSSIPYYIAVIWWPELMFVGTPMAGEIADVSLKSVALACAIFYIASVLIILVMGFLYLAKRIEGDNRKRAYYGALTFLFFGIGAILDTVLSTSFIYFARVVTALSIICAFKAFYIKREVITK